MNEWTLAFFVVAALGIIIWFTYQRSLVAPLEPGTIVIHPEVGRSLFSHLFASALLDANGREVLTRLMRTSGMNFTPREAVMLKFVLGEIDKEELVREVENFTKNNPSFHDPVVLLEQIQVLKSVLEKDKKGKWSNEHLKSNVV